jgi:SAM-dependent methyltransferase
MSEANKAQIDLWNGRVGDKWAAMQLTMDAMLAQATAELKARAGVVAGQRVLDIGCGNGTTCLVWLAGGAEVTGVDVSAAMLAVAASRTKGKATLVQADASVWRGNSPFDLATSQFGLMFFADPDSAFANIAANVRPGGRLLFMCWRALAENPWATTPIDAIRDLLPDAPPADPQAPGPFALADRNRLGGILERAGFTSIGITPCDFAVCLATEGGVDAAARLATQIGPAGSALTGATAEVLAAAQERLKVALAPHDQNGVVTLGGAVWLVEAIRPPQSQAEDSGPARRTPPGLQKS